MATESLQLFRSPTRGEVGRDGGPSFIDDELERETLSTEKLRVSVLLIVAGLGLAFSVVPVSLFLSNFERTFEGHAETFVNWRFAVLLTWLLSLFGERLLLGRLNLRGRRLPRLYRYF